MPFGVTVSVAVKEPVCVVKLVFVHATPLVVHPGVELLTVTATGVAFVCPVELVQVAPTVCEPLPTLVVSHRAENGVTVPAFPKVEPSIRN